MLIPVRWKTFLRDFLIIQIGFALFGLSIATMIRSNFGTSPWALLEVALSDLTGMTPGRMSILVGFVVLLVALAMGEKVGWGTLSNILFIGLWEDMFLHLIPSVENNLILQVLMLLSAVLMMAVHRKSGWSIRLGRAVIEIIVVIVGFFLGGPLGFGTILFALLIGPSVQWAFKLFHVKPHKPEPEVVEAATD